MSIATTSTDTCRRCGGPIDRGRAGSQPPTGRHRTCLPCQVAASLAGWQPPADAGLVDYDDVGDPDEPDTPPPSRGMPPDLRERLAAAGGLFLDEEAGEWGSYYVMTPACCRRSRMWMTPAALADWLPYWERGEDGP